MSTLELQQTSQIEEGLHLLNLIKSSMNITNRPIKHLSDTDK